MNFLKKPILLLIRVYQKTLSPDRGWVRYVVPLRPTCTMYPSCSEYFYLAVEKYGAFYGTCKGISRIFRCHPYQKKLVDHPY